MFEVKRNRKRIRIGEIKTPHGIIKTPAFLPDATYGTVKTVTFNDLKKSGINQMLCTTLHLHLKPGDKYIKRMGGMHKYYNWDRPILTDSGGWQVFSIINQSGKGKVSEEGAEFIIPDSGKKHLLTPKHSIDIQANLRSDIFVVLDDPIIGNTSFKKNKEAVDLTIIWARKAKQAFLKRYQLDEDKFNNPEKYKRPLLFCVIQGGNYKRLRKKCAEELIGIGFDGFGYGGILIKEERKTTREMLKYVTDIVPEEKIRYGMGVGRISDIKYCIENGYDLFDSVVPTRNGRHGTCYTRRRAINLKGNKYKYDNRSIDKDCECEACKVRNKRPTASRAYISYLLRIGEPVGMRYCTIHNLRTYSKLMNEYKE